MCALPCIFIMVSDMSLLNCWVDEEVKHRTSGFLDQDVLLHCRRGMI